MLDQKRRISTLIETQLPGFISDEYENFSKFLEYYYEQLEFQGQPLDIINNLESYVDISTYSNKSLVRYDYLKNSVTNTDTTIEVNDGSSFPEENGYIKIGAEICFYKERNGNTLLNVSRGVSGNSSLGDLYEETEFVTTEASPHSAGTAVYNVSNFFLYALVKNFENQYLVGFPEKYLIDAADKRTLIKYISDFYRSKGTNRSINFIFNTILNKNGEVDSPETYNPKDFTIKASSSNWVKTYSLRVKTFLGSPLDLIGKKIEQKTKFGIVSAVVDNAVYVGLVNNEQIYELILAESSITGNFEEAAKTSLTRAIGQSTSTGDAISVFSTMGWRDNFGEVLIGTELITFNNKSVSDFTINNRSKTLSYAVGTPVYSNSIATDGNVEVIIFSVVYQLENTAPQPFAVEKDSIQITEPGFKTLDPIIYNDLPFVNSSFRSDTRWLLYSEDPVASTNLLYRGGTEEYRVAVNKFPYNVSAIYEDESYYYICSSGYPSYTGNTAYTTFSFNNGLTGSDLKDQSNLKLIRKSPINTTEVYSTGTRDVGILVDGTLAYSAKDIEYVEYGNIESIQITNKGRGYKNLPFVLINNRAGFATATLSGEVVNEIKIIREDVYKNNPTITITSGRKGTAVATVTDGKITQIKVTSPGEYYSTPPVVRIIDNAGRGRFAEYESVIDTKGRLVGFNKISEGNFYSQENIQVEIVPVGSDANATASIKKWHRNRYGRVNESNSHTYYEVDGGFTKNIDPTKGYGYAVWAWPPDLAAILYESTDPTSPVFTKSRHSRIFGYAYDGNPIYGPLGYSNPFDPSSSITLLQSGYKQKTVRVNGPSTSQYPLGSFIDDYEYEYTNEYGRTVLDERNGRFCVTPEYPNGTYAYFMPLTSYSLPSETSLSPKYPYILGPSYYSLPVDSNSNSFISQKDLPSNVRRYREKNITKNGNGFEAFVGGVNTGNISGFEIIDSIDGFSVGGNVYLDNTGTDGSDASAVVSEVFGKPVTSIESKETKSVKIRLVNSAYLFAGDTLTQSGTNASGTLLGSVSNGTELVLTNVSGDFNNTDIYSASIQVVNLLLNQDSSYTLGANLQLKDAKNNILANGEVLEGTLRQNSVKLKVTSGSFFTYEWKAGQIYQPNDYIYYGDLFYKVTNTDPGSTGTNPPTHRFGTISNGSLNLEFLAESPFLQSSALIDTVATEIISSTSLSSGLLPFSIDKNIAVLKTSVDHGITQGDIVNVEIDPDLSAKLTEYYIRKRAFQTVKLNPPKFSGQIKSSGVGRIDILNPGSNYVGFATYEDVELIFLDSEKSRPNVGIGGDLGNARATVNVNNNGEISSILITDPGFGYKKGDYLTIPGGSLGRTGEGVNCILDVDHAGLAAENTTFILDSVAELSNQDLLKIRDEIVRIETINVQEKQVTVTRAVESTIASDHYTNETVTLYNPRYRFNFGDDLGTNFGDPKVLKYDPDTHVLDMYFDILSPQRNAISISSTFRDYSVQRKKVSVAEVFDIVEKLEFGTDPTVDSSFKTELAIDTQKYYKYRFNYTHSSMLGTYVGLSPSKSENLATPEIIPGIGYFDIVFGYGNYTSSNTYTKREDIKYSNYYFFVRNSDTVQANVSLRLIDDPLQGQKVVDYVTNDAFVYSLESSPQYDGSGDIRYTTSGLGATGKISSIAITNLGSGYKALPIVSGISVPTSNEAILDVSYDPVNKIIVDVAVVDGGQNYYSPKVEVVSGGGSGYKFQVLTNNRKIVRVIVLEGGTGYTTKPTLKIVESDVEIYPLSNNIATPRNIRVINPGSAFNTDRTLLAKYRSNYTLKLSGVKGKTFYSGEVVRQIDSNGNQICQAIVSENGWRNGSNLLRVREVVGEFLLGASIQSSLKPINSGIIEEIFVTDFGPILKSYFDNIGEYKSDVGKISVGSQKITDSYYYQDYSYVVKSKKSINDYRDLLKGSTHPAGFQLFGEMMIDSEAPNRMPEKTPRLLTHKIITLYDENANLVTTSIVKERATQSISNVSFGSIPGERGLGSIAIEDFNLSETYANVVDIVGNFDGVFQDKTGIRSGTTTFGLIDSLTNLPYVPFNEYELVVTLDGIVQEPGVAYTISGSNIIFSEAPLGARDDQKTFEDGSRIFKWEAGKQTNAGDFVWHINGIVYLALTTGTLGSTPPSHTTQTAPNGSVTLEYSNLTKIPSTKFYCKSFRFKNNGTNARYLKKIRNIFQRNGRWLDAANQIESNKQFIQEETLGYIKNKYPLLNWNTFEQKCSRDIGYIVDGYAKDLRFGGNTFTVTNGKLYYDGNVLDHIEGQLTETLEAFEYAARLCKLAMRNWDYVYDNVTYFQGSDIMIVDDTSNIAIGMYVSAGDSYPEGTVVEEIISDTQIRLSNFASGAAGSELISTDTLIVQDTTTLTTTVGVSAILRVLEPYFYRVLAGGSNQATFYWSGVNTGTYYDAANLILANKENIQKEASFAITDGYQLFQYPNQPLEASVYKDARRLIYKNRDFIADYIVELIDGQYPGFGYGGPNGRAKCRRDLTYIIDALATDLGRGSNNNMIEATKYYFDASNNLINNGLVGELDEAIFAYTQLITICNYIITNQASPGGILDGIQTLSGRTPYFDLDILNDPTTSSNDNIANCATVQSSIDVLIHILIDALTNARDGNVVTYPPESTGIQDWYKYEELCKRDIGYLVEDVAYHLKFGGNRKIVEFGKFYYQGTNNKVGFIGNELNETVYAFNYARDLMIAAMRNQLSGDTIITAFVDPNVAQDVDSPACVEVASSISSMVKIVEDTLKVGKNLYVPTPENSNYPGKWSTTLSKSNYNLIADPQLVASECEDVGSALSGLYANLEKVLTLGVNSIPETLIYSDYFNGVTKSFDLYYDDGTDVVLDPNENLLVCINGIIQLPQHAPNLPLGDSYYIDRTATPNKIVFSEPPLWDQSDNVKLLQEGLAIDKFFARTIGSYERLTVDAELINGKNAGPFVMKSVKDTKVKSISNPRYAMVFIDGVLQKDSDAYTIAGPAISFTEPLRASGKQKQKVDIFLYYGKDTEQTATGFDYEIDTYFNRCVLRIQKSGSYNEFINWYAGYADVSAYQVIGGKKYSMGSLRSYYQIDSTTWEVVFSSNNPNFDASLPVYFVPNNNLEGIALEISAATLTLTFTTDLDGNRRMQKDVTKWMYDSGLNDPAWAVRNSLRGNLLPGDLIKIDGEDDYRTVVDTPAFVTSRNHLPGDKTSTNFYGQLKVSNYSGIRRGEGLSVTCEIDQNTGKVTKLNWDDNSLDLYFNENLNISPTAYQYFWTPVLNFVSIDGTGGGAEATVIVSGGQIVDVVLTKPGYGYTQAPNIVVSRGYERIKKDRKIDFFVNLNFVNKVSQGMSEIVTSYVSISPPNLIPGITTIVDVRPGINPDDENVRRITNIIAPDPDLLGGEHLTDPINYDTVHTSVIAIKDLSVFVSDSVIIDYERTTLPQPITATSEISRIVSFDNKTITGVVDNGYFDYQLDYDGGVLGNRASQFTNAKFVGGGVLDTSINFVELDQWFPNMTIEDWEKDELKATSFTKDGQWNWAYPTETQYMTYVDTIAIPAVGGVGYSATNATVYAGSTRLFPSSGVILVGRELISYTSKQSDRFLGCTRGYNGTPIESHDILEFIKTTYP